MPTTGLVSPAYFQNALKKYVSPSNFTLSYNYIVIFSNMF